MELHESDTPRKPLSRRRKILMLAAAAVIGSAAGIVLIVRAAAPSNPVEAVQGFMNALSSGDLDSAEEYLSQPLPTGPDAVFLHPGALSDDWHLTKATETDASEGDLRRVAVTIRDGDDREFSGELQVATSDRFVIVDAFTRIEFETRYETVVSVNGHTAVLEPNAEVLLLPGMYEFAYDAYQLAPVAILGQAAIYEPVPSSEAIDNPDLNDTLQEAIQARLDECQAFLTSQPHGCPFGMPRQLVHADYDHAADTGEGLLIDLEEPEWNLVRYPVLEAWIDPELEEPGWFGVRFADPGLLELTVTGTDMETSESRRVTVECPMDDDDMAAVLHLDGSIELGEVQQMFYTYLGSLVCGEWQ